MVFLKDKLALAWAFRGWQTYSLRVYTFVADSDTVAAWLATVAADLSASAFEAGT